MSSISWQAEVAWWVSAFLSYGLQLAYWQRQFPLIASKHRWLDMGFSAVSAAVFGPTGLLVFVVFVSFGGGGLKGFLLWPEDGPAEEPDDAA